MFDDLTLPFATAEYAHASLVQWMSGVRPLLMASYWVNYQISGTDTLGYHLTNFLLHVFNAGLIALVTRTLLLRIGLRGASLESLTLLAGGLFLLHPVNVESVSYVAGRSELLSSFFYYSALALFLSDEDMHIAWSSITSLVFLLGASLLSKEHTVTLPLLLVTTDWFWGLGGWKRNKGLYCLLGGLGALGSIAILRLVLASKSTGFGLPGLGPNNYFWTQCRVIFIYARQFLAPYGLNADYDVPISTGPLDHNAWVALFAAMVALSIALLFRKRFPLASFGIVVFVLMIAPTSSVMPIADLQADRRLYLPFWGLSLILIEFLRHVAWRRIVVVSTIALACLGLLTYQRTAVWASPEVLWKDVVSKSPHKWRPRVQLGYALYVSHKCPQAVEQYQMASTLKNPDAALYTNWALSLDCANRSDEALALLHKAADQQPTAHVYSQIGMVSAKQRRFFDAFTALARAEALDPAFSMTFAYRGGIYELQNDRVRALAEYRRCLDLDSTNQMALEGIRRIYR